MDEEVTIDKECNMCNGWGWINSGTNGSETISLEDYIRGRYVAVMCPRCLGKKRLDWIEEITGVRRLPIKHENH